MPAPSYEQQAEEGVQQLRSKTTSCGRVLGDGVKQEEQEEQEEQEKE